MCSCCCPPAITALFYLWVRSGFSKGSVAGALTFFPPDPPLYKFERVNKDGEVLEDDDEEGTNNQNGVGRMEGKDDEDYYDDDDDDSDLGTFEIDTSSSHQMNNNNKKKNSNDQADDEAKRKQQRQNRQEQQQRQQEAASQDPIVAMTERSNKLRKRAKYRAKIDSEDHTINGVTYNFIPDTSILGNLPSFNGTIHPIKIGPQKRTGTYIAALLYKLPSNEITDKTKTILYSHGNATDIGAMAGLQCLIAKNLKCNVLVYDYSGYGESGGIPMEKNTYRDVKMVYEWVVSNVTKHEHNVILYGQSVGSGPSCYLASRRNNVGGLILHSPFTSGMRVLTPSRALACLDIFPNIDRIKKVKCKVFIIHGKKDVEVKFEHGYVLSFIHL